MDVIGRAMSRVIEREDTEILVLLARLVVTREEAFVVRVDDVRVARIGNDEAALPAAGMRPIALLDDAAIGAARDAHVRVVLLRAIDVVRKRVVDRDVIELRSRLVAVARPALAAV